MIVDTDPDTRPDPDPGPALTMIFMLMLTNAVNHDATSRDGCQELEQDIRRATVRSRRKGSTVEPLMPHRKVAVQVIRHDVDEEPVGRVRGDDPAAVRELTHRIAGIERGAGRDRQRGLQLCGILRVRPSAQAEMQVWAPCSPA